MISTTSVDPRLFIFQGNLINVCIYIVIINIAIYLSVRVVHNPTKGTDVANMTSAKC